MKGKPVRAMTRREMLRLLGVGTSAAYLAACAHPAAPSEAGEQPAAADEGPITLRSASWGWGCALPPSAGESSCRNPRICAQSRWRRGCCCPASSLSSPSWRSTSSATACATQQTRTVKSSQFQSLGNCAIARACVLLGTKCSARWTAETRLTSPKAQSYNLCLAPHHS